MLQEHSAHTSGNRIKYYKKLGESDENHQQAKPTNAKCRQVPHHFHKTGQILRSNLNFAFRLGPSDQYPRRIGMLRVFSIRARADRTVRFQTQYLRYFREPEFPIVHRHCPKTPIFNFSNSS